MDFSLKNSLERQYTGFLNTEVLFDQFYDSMDFFTLNKSFLGVTKLSSDFLMPENIRLGQRMEYFMEEALKSGGYEILVKNLQIIHRKTTLGEIDFIVQNIAKKTSFQLELVYKFYMFDPKIKGHWCKQWVGANRTDSLYLKLKKLKEKQLPLVYAPETAPYLDSLGLKKERLGQKVCFKGQLFLPFEQKCDLNEHLNPAAIVGHWLKKEDLPALEHLAYKLLIPDRNDWVTIPTSQDSLWKKPQDQRHILEALLQRRHSTLIWTMDKNGAMNRFYLVWWP